MNKIIELLNENAYWYLNRFCFGEVLERHPSKRYTCDQCGDYNGTYDNGNFKYFVEDDLADNLYSELFDLATEEKYELWVSKDYDVVSDEYSAEELVDLLLQTKEFQEEMAVQLYIDGESYSVSFDEIPKELIIAAVEKILK